MYFYFFIFQMFLKNESETLLLCVIIFSKIFIIFKNCLSLKITTLPIFPSDFHETHPRFKLTSPTQEHHSTRPQLNLLVRINSKHLNSNK